MPLSTDKSLCKTLKVLETRKTQLAWEKRSFWCDLPDWILTRQYSSLMDANRLRRFHPTGLCSCSAHWNIKRADRTGKIRIQNHKMNVRAAFIDYHLDDQTLFRFATVDTESFSWKWKEFIPSLELLIFFRTNKTRVKRGFVKGNVARKAMAVRSLGRNLIGNDFRVMPTFHPHPHTLEFFSLLCFAYRIDGRKAKGCWLILNICRVLRENPFSLSLTHKSEGWADDVVVDLRCRSSSACWCLWRKSGKHRRNNSRGLAVCSSFVSREFSWTTRSGRIDCCLSSGSIGGRSLGWMVRARFS